MTSLRQLVKFATFSVTAGGRDLQEQFLVIEIIFLKP